jgi:uncharacterized protein (TIGR04255 family)
MPEILRPEAEALTPERLPRRLKQDAIVEAVAEFRFETSTIFELVLGRLVDRDDWKGYAQNRLPASEIPPQLRLADADLRYVPLFELAGHEGRVALRVGPNVISFHRKAPYVGWSEFRRNIECTLESLFAIADKPTIHRIGLRYLNALGPKHMVRSLSELNLQLAVGKKPISDDANLNFLTRPGPRSLCMARIATKGFVKGPIPAETTVYVDVDVYTEDGFATADKPAAVAWVEEAHIQEKLAFFSLFTPEHLDNLRES